MSQLSGLGPPPSRWAGSLWAIDYTVRPGWTSLKITLCRAQKHALNIMVNGRQINTLMVINVVFVLIARRINDKGEIFVGLSVLHIIHGAGTDKLTGYISMNA